MVTYYPCLDISVGSLPVPSGGGSVGNITDYLAVSEMAAREKMECTY